MYVLYVCTAELKCNVDHEMYTNMQNVTVYLGAISLGGNCEDL